MQNVLNNDDTTSWSAEMSEASQEVPCRNMRLLNENEQRAFASWLVTCEPTTAEYDLFQGQVPLGRVSFVEADPDPDSEDLALGTELTKSQLLEPTYYTEQPTGFPDAKDISLDGFRFQSYSITPDVILVGKQHLDVVEIKTRNQRISGRNDVHEAVGQLHSYTTELRRDYPKLMEEYEVRGFVLAEDSTVDIALIRSVFEEYGYGYFDRHQGGYMIDHR